MYVLLKTNHLSFLREVKKTTHTPNFTLIIIYIMIKKTMKQSF